MAETRYPVGGDPVGDADPQRAELAKLMAYIAARGNTRTAFTPENLWALQGQSQFPQPQPDPDIRRFSVPEAQHRPNDRLPTRQLVDDERFTRFPMQGEPKPGEGEAPFGGKGQVVGPYEPPKREKKKGKR